MPVTGRTSSISLADLIALNDEIAALVRTGVPLERGLLGLAGDLPGRLGRLTAVLSEHMSRGETLPQALAAARGQFPPLYLALVEAGLKSGRLSTALEGLAATARRMAELRSVVGLALLYPLLVLVLACALSAFLVIKIAPGVVPILKAFEAPAASWLSRVAALGPSLASWWPLAPAAVVALALVWWWQSGRALLLQPRFATRALGWIPGIRKLFAHSQMATFADVLALLVEQRAPLDQAVVLAAEATGSPALIAEGRRIGDALRQGTSPAECWQGSTCFPPLVCWLIASGQRHGILARALRHCAQTYRDRALSRGEVTRIFLPVFLTLALGGSATLAYGVLVFLPWISLLRSLTGP